MYASRLHRGAQMNRRTLLVSGEDEQVNVAMEFGVRERFELIGVRIIPDGIVRIHPLCEVHQYTWPHAT